MVVEHYPKRVHSIIRKFIQETKWVERLIAESNGVRQKKENVSRGERGLQLLSGDMALSLSMNTFKVLCSMNISAHRLRD